MEHIEDMADRIKVLDEQMLSRLDVRAAFGINNPVGTARTLDELLRLIAKALTLSPTGEVLLLPEGARPAPEANADTERLDWLERNGQRGAVLWRGVQNIWVLMGQNKLHNTVREAIDAGMKEAK